MTGCGTNRYSAERACSEERRVLASLLGVRKFENPYRARDAVTFFEPQPSEWGPLRERGVHAQPLLWKGSLKRLRDPQPGSSQVQTGAGTRHNGRGSLFFPKDALRLAFSPALNLT